MGKVRYAAISVRQRMPILSFNLVAPSQLQTGYQCTVTDLKRVPRLEHISVGRQVPSALEWEVTFGTRSRLLTLDVEVDGDDELEELLQGPLVPQLRSLICYHVCSTVVGTDVWGGDLSTIQVLSNGGRLGSANLCNLKSLHFDRGTLYAEDLEHLANPKWTQLTRLDLLETTIPESEMLQQWTWCSNLVSLELMDTPLEPGLQYLLKHDFPFLEYAGFSNTELDEGDVTVLFEKEFPLLRKLNLSLVSLNRTRGRGLGARALEIAGIGLVLLVQLTDDALLALIDGNLHGLTKLRLGANSIYSQWAFQVWCSGGRKIQTHG